MSNVYRLFGDVSKKLDNDGEPPDDDDMEKRIKILEDGMTSLKIDVAVIRSNYATKEDIHKEISAQTWRLVTYVTSIFVTVSTALVGITYYIATHAK